MEATNEQKQLDFQVPLFRLEQRMEQVEMRLQRQENSHDFDMIIQKLCTKIDAHPDIFIPNFFKRVDKIDRLQQIQETFLEDKISKKIKGDLPDFETMENCIRRVTMKTDHLEAVWNPKRYEQFIGLINKIEDMNSIIESTMIKMSETATKFEMQAIERIISADTVRKNEFEPVVNELVTCVK